MIFFNQNLKLLKIIDKPINNPSPYKLEII